MEEGGMWVIAILMLALGFAVGVLIGAMLEKSLQRRREFRHLLRFRRRA